MLRWIAGVCLCAAIACPVWAGQTTVNEVGQANELYKAGKKLEALPLYEDLAKTYPDEMIYQERLASCLDAEAEQTNDAAQKKALLTRMRDTARRAVQLGDKANLDVYKRQVGERVNWLQRSPGAGGPEMAGAKPSSCGRACGIEWPRRGERR